MDPMECMAWLAALIPLPRYPLVRYAGVLGPRSAWRKDIVPRPRDRQHAMARVRDVAVALGGEASGDQGGPPYR
jgi:hypothetical protein